MRAVKTAISVEKELFEKAEELARTMKVSRSRLFVIALQSFMKQQENKALLSQINEAYADEPDEAEQMLRRKSRQSHRRVVENEW